MADLISCFEKSGFRITRKTYFNTMLFPLILGVRLLNKIGLCVADDDQLPSPAVNALLKFIFGLEKYLVPRFALPFGVSLLVIAQKNNGTVTFL